MRNDNEESAALQTLVVDDTLREFDRERESHGRESDRSENDLFTLARSAKACDQRRIPSRDAVTFQRLATRRENGIEFLVLDKESRRGFASDAR